MIAALLACATPEPLPEVAAIPASAVVRAPEKPASPPASTHRVSAGRLVAVGDLHGDSVVAVQVLAMAGLVDASGAWTGGTATLVQTGDTTDRGPDSKGVLALLRRLQGEAAAAGGAVVPLLGNHEVMNVLGDWRYVSEGDLAGYGGDAARRQAYAQDGEDGRWLGTLDAVAIVDDTVFCHGGLREVWAKLGTDALNQQIRDAMFAGGNKPLVIGDTGPLWYRGYAKDPETEVCDELGRALQLVDAKRLVIGHTVQEDGKIHARCDGRVVLIDTGISAHYGTHLSALEIVAGDAKALYATGPEDLVDPR